jgi:hypothetical protein
MVLLTKQLKSTDTKYRNTFECDLIKDIKSSEIITKCKLIID